MLDLLIKNGRVVDGSGQAAFYADVAVKAGKIVGVGKCHEAAMRTINADGRVVAPGFIDHHTHFDSQAMWDPIVNSTSLNGNTSIIVGQCGAVIAPVRPGTGTGTCACSTPWRACRWPRSGRGLTSPGRPFRNTWMPSSDGAVST